MMQWLNNRVGLLRDAIKHRKILLTIGAGICLILGTFDYLKDMAGKIIRNFISTPASIEGGNAVIYGIPSWLLGITLLLFFAFVWMLEYAAKLRRQIIPQITARFDGTIPACQSVSTFTDGTEAIVFRIEVENLGIDIAGFCQAYLIEVHYHRDRVELGAMRLTWASAIPPFAVDLIKGVRRHLDVLQVRKDGHITVCADMGWPINQSKFFERHGDYFFTIVISNTVTAPLAPKRYRLHFTGDWQTTTFHEDLR